MRARKLTSPAFRFSLRLLSPVKLGLALLSLWSLWFMAATAQAADISVVGLFPGKAVLVIGQAAPKAYPVGATISEGIKLIGADDSTATFEMQGKRHILGIGQHAAPPARSGAATVVLQADSRGHFAAQGHINGVAVQMLVDTGATSIALSAAEAQRLGIDYKKGQVGRVETANGMAAAYRIKLNTVRLGDIEVNNIDAVVLEHGMSSTLLGMSFLNRTQMHRDGEHMTLTKRF